MNAAANIVTRRVYFAVPGHYGYSELDADTFEEAAGFARSSIEAFSYGGHSRAFVDVRVADENGDRPIYRFEIFHDGTTDGGKPQ